MFPCVGIASGMSGGLALNFETRNYFLWLLSVVLILVADYLGFHCFYPCTVHSFFTPGPFILRTLRADDSKGGLLFCKLLKRVFLVFLNGDFSDLNMLLSNPLSLKRGVRPLLLEDLLQ